MIIGFSETILQSPGAYGKKIPPALLADLMVIYRNAEHLSELINDVLDLSQVDAEKMALTKEQAQLEEIVEEAATAIRPLYSSKGLYLELDIPKNLPPVFCDRTRPDVGFVQFDIFRTFVRDKLLLDITDQLKADPVIGKTRLLHRAAGSGPLHPGWPLVWYRFVLGGAAHLLQRRRF